MKKRPIRKCDIYTCKFGTDVKDVPWYVLSEVSLSVRRCYVVMVALLKIEIMVICVFLAQCTLPVMAQWMRPRTLNNEVPGSNLVAAVY